MKKKLAILLPSPYKGGSFQAAKNLAKAIILGSKEMNDEIDVVFSYVENYYDIKKDFKDLRIKPEELILHYEVIDDKGENFFTKHQVIYYVVLESNKDILIKYLNEAYTNPTISSTPILTAEEFHETFLEFIMDQPKLAADLYDKFLKYEDYLVLTGATECVEDPFATPFDDSPVYHLPEQLKEKELVPVAVEPYPPAPVMEVQVPPPAPKVPISEVFDKLIETFDLKVDDKFNGLNKKGLVLDVIPFEEPEVVEVEVIEEAQTTV